MGLVKAAQRYDPKRGVPFPAFALMYVRGAILDSIRERARRNADRNGGFFTEVSFDEPAHGESEDRRLKREPVDPRPGPEEMVVHRDQLRLVEDLPPRERYVLLRTEVDGASAEEVGRELGCSANRVYTLASWGATRLRRRAA